MGKVKEQLLGVNAPKVCPVVVLEAKDFQHGSGNFVPLWHAAKVANVRLALLNQTIDRLVLRNQQLSAQVEDLKVALVSATYRG